ncbi:hypothetical protein ACOBQX_04860 [Actinokineospora sp. G85]|uniref:hypothetical protein n=1 Tax=Actinokineospora sp. G85 TaxID=3406626 RepID=UPI003C71E0B8
MICPHCSRDLRRKQRRRRMCAHCGKEFVFEPKRDKVRLHDLRVRKLAERLSGPDRLWFTHTQLWYAAARKVLAEPYKPLDGLGPLLALACLPAAAVVSFFVGGDEFVGIALVCGIVALAVFLLLAALVRPWLVRTHQVRVPMPLAQLTRELDETWPRLHGGPVPGLITAVPRRPGGRWPRCCARTRPCSPASPRTGGSATPSASPRSTRSPRGCP